MTPPPGELQGDVASFRTLSYYIFLSINKYEDCTTDGACITNSGEAPNSPRPNKTGHADQRKRWESKAGHERIGEASMMSTEYFKAAIDCIGDPVFAKDRHYKFVFVNDAACEMFGKPREQVLGRTDYELFPKEQADVFRRHDNSVFATGEADVHEEQVTDAQGNVRTIVTKRTLYINEAGERCILGAIRDITDRKRSEEELRASRLRLSEAMDLAHIVYWEVDPVTNTFTFNDPFYMFYGTTAEREGGYQ